MIPRKRHLLIVGRCFLCVGLICVGVVLAIGYKVAFVVYEAGIPLTHTDNRDVIAQRRTSSAIHFWLVRHLEWHDAQRFNESARRILFLPSGHIGAQVKALAWSYAVAVVTRRVLLVDWYIPDALSTRAKTRFVVAPPYRRREEDENIRAKNRSHMLKLLAGEETTVILTNKDLQNAAETVDSLSRLRWPMETLPPYEWAVRRAAIRTILEPSNEFELLVKSISDKLELCSYDEKRCDDGWKRFWRRPKRRYFAVHARIASVAAHENLMRIAFCFSVALRKYAGHDAPVVYVSSDTVGWRDLFSVVMKNAMPRAKVVHEDWIGLSENMALFAEQFIIGDATRVVSHRAEFTEAAFLRGSARFFSIMGNESCSEGNRIDFDSDRNPPFW